MIDPDDAFGHNAQVQYLRSIFAQIEKAQRELLLKIGIAPFDERLRRVRRGTLNLFEISWGKAMQMGIIKDETDVSVLYIHCLFRALVTEGVTVTRDILPQDARIEKFVNEALR